MIPLWTRGLGRLQGVSRLVTRSWLGTVRAYITGRGRKEGLIHIDGAGGIGLISVPVAKISIGEAFMTRLEGSESPFDTRGKGGALG